MSLLYWMTILLSPSVSLSLSSFLWEDCELRAIPFCLWFYPSFCCFVADPLKAAQHHGLIMACSAQHLRPPLVLGNQYSVPHCSPTMHVVAWLCCSLISECRNSWASKKILTHNSEGFSLCQLYSTKCDKRGTDFDLCQKMLPTAQWRPEPNNYDVRQQIMAYSCFSTRCSTETDCVCLAARFPLSKFFYFDL